MYIMHCALCVSSNVDRRPSSRRCRERFPGSGSVFAKQKLMIKIAHSGMIHKKIIRCGTKIKLSAYDESLWFHIVIERMQKNRAARRWRLQKNSLLSFASLIFHRYIYSLQRKQLISSVHDILSSRAFRPKLTYFNPKVRIWTEI